MSKQNRLAPKYILIAPSQSDPPRRKQPLKKRTMPAKREPKIDTTAPAPWHPSKSSLHKETLRSLSRETGKDMESIREQLAECMSAIQQESRKNAVMKELIEVVGQQMAAAMEAQKQAQKVMVEETLKRAHKVEYDIEQILQKHNEEVAKTITLKEQVAAARSDRLVFSNLFRKLQKEIKRSEEYYRSLTITTEINRQRKAERELKQRELAQQQQQISVDEIQPREEPVTLQGNKTSTKKPTMAPTCKFFLTSPNATTTPSKKGSNCSLQAGGASQSLRYMIESVQGKIQKIAKTGECGSWAQAMEFYSTVQQQNQHLADLVLEEDRKIELVQEEIARIQLQRRISEVYQSRHLGKLENLASMRKIRSIKHIKTTATQQTEKYDEDTQLLAQVVEVLGLPSQHTSDLLMGKDDTMSALWAKLDTICSSAPFKKSDSNLSNHSAEHDLDNILSKMQRFQSCDRILNRKQFYTEYVREVSRNKRSLRRK